MADDAWEIVAPDREKHLNAICDLWGSLRGQSAGHLTDLLKDG